MTKNIKTLSDLRTSFLEFYKEKGHAHIESSSLLINDDPTLLFVNSGMVQFKDVFCGTDKRSYSTATTCQKSLRVEGKHNDLDDIGRTARHHTFFEMLGNFSFGDYFKEDAIKYAWEFVTEVIKLPKDLLWVSVHETDIEAENLWKTSTDIDPLRIVKLGDKTNLWAMGNTGPCGYNSEIFYYMGDAPEKQSTEEFLEDDGTYLEIWNLVFMQFERNEAGDMTPLPKPSIDTGMGLERVASILQGVPSNYDVDSIRDVISGVEKISGKVFKSTFSKNDKKQYDIDVAMRVIADHSRAATFLIADGVSPGSDGESYVLRRLIRRAIRYASQYLQVEGIFLHEVCNIVIDKMKETYPEIGNSKKLIVELVKAEEAKFRETLRKGMELLSQYSSDLQSGDIFPGEIAFKLNDTFGFPLDLTEDALRDRGIVVDRKRFNKEMELQKERSKGSLKKIDIKISSDLGDVKNTTFVGYDKLLTQAPLSAVLELGKEPNSAIGLIFPETVFYAEMGGQIGDVGFIELEGQKIQITDTQKDAQGNFVHICNADSNSLKSLVGKVAKLEVDKVSRRKIETHHSATHLLHAALRTILGDHIEQRGSLVETNRLRFDFSHFKSLDPSQKKEIQAFVNEEIEKNHKVEIQEMKIGEAKKLGAMAIFGEKYGDWVRVVSMGPNSIELCGGTHVKETAEISLALLGSEGSVSSGVRRIDMKVGEEGHKELLTYKESIEKLAKVTNSKPEEILNRVQSVVNEVKELKTKLKGKDKQIAQLASTALSSNVKENTSGLKYLVSKVSADSRDLLLDLASEVSSKINGVVALVSEDIEMLVIKVPKKLDGFDAGAIAKKVCAEFDVKGGGKKESATVSGVSGVLKDKVLVFLNSLF